MSSSPATAWVFLLLLLLSLSSVLDCESKALVCGPRHLECSAKPCAGRMTEIGPPSLRKSLRPKQVSGLLFHGFLGLSHMSHFLVD